MMVFAVVLVSALLFWGVGIFLLKHFIFDDLLLHLKAIINRMDEDKDKEQQ